MEIPIVKLKLPSGIEVEMLEYINAGLVIDSNAKDNVTDGQKFLIENVIVSINGKKENLYQEARALRFSDYQKIDSKIKELITGEVDVVKKN